MCPPLWPVRLPGEAGPVRLASRLDNSKCMERLSSEAAGVQSSSMPLVPEEKAYLIPFNK